MKKYGIYSNAELSTKMIAEFCRLDTKGEELLKSAFKKHILFIMIKK